VDSARKYIPTTTFSDVRISSYGTHKPKIAVSGGTNNNSEGVSNKFANNECICSWLEVYSKTITT